MKQRDAEVQTGLELDEMILKYYWMTHEAIPSVAAARHADVRHPDVATEPKIAQMAVSSEALEGVNLQLHV